jgi:monothiol glutaredoxin
MATLCIGASLAAMPLSQSASHRASHSISTTARALSRRENGVSKLQLSSCRLARRERNSFQCRASMGAPSGVEMSPELKSAVEKYLTENKVVLFMKGNKLFPQCGFSNTCVMILNEMGVPYETVNILENEELRQGMKSYSNWPTFPQLYIDGEFFGGCDITIEAFQSGELKEILEKAMLA